jgi:hypothetical protein
MSERGENTMTVRTPAWRVAHAAVSTLVLSWMLGVSPASAARPNATDDADKSAHHGHDTLQRLIGLNPIHR